MSPSGDALPPAALRTTYRHSRVPPNDRDLTLRVGSPDGTDPVGNVGRNDAPDGLPHRRVSGREDDHVRGQFNAVFHQNARLGELLDILALLDLDSTVGNHGG